MKKDLSVLENMKYGQEGIEASLQRVWLVGRNLGKERVFKELQYLWSRRKVSAQNGISRLFEPSY